MFLLYLYGYQSAYKCMHTPTQTRTGVRLDIAAVCGVMVGHVGTFSTAHVFETFAIQRPSMITLDINPGLIIRFSL